MVESVTQKCNQKWNKDKSLREFNNPKEHNAFKIDCIWNPATYSCENSKSFASTIDDSVIACDEIVEETRNIPKKFIAKNITCKRKKFYILLAFLLIAVVLLIAVSIYFYFIKHIASKNIYYYIMSQIID